MPSKNHRFTVPAHRAIPPERGRDKAYILIFAVLLLAFLAALTAAFSTLVFKNSRQSTYYGRRLELRRYAETGIDLALYELKYYVNGSDGKIGTESWTTASDLGRDGKANTHDEGEGNGMPGPGEANTVPASIGPSDLGIRLLVRTTDTAWSGIKKIDAVAWNADATANVQTYAQIQPGNLTALGAAYVEGGAKWGLSGSSFIRGFDTNPPTTLTATDGTPGTGAAIPAIATSIGNESAFQTQLASRASYYTGLQDDAAGTASVEQYQKPDFDTQFNSLVPKATNIVTAGSHSSVQWGNWLNNDYKITYCSGDLSISSGVISGILLVNGKLTVNGPAKIVGLVMVKSSVIFTGGSGGKIYGALWAKTPVDFKMSGDAAIIYSTKALAAVSSLAGMNGTYAVLHWSYPK